MGNSKYITAHLCSYAVGNCEQGESNILGKCTIGCIVILNCSEVND